MAACREIRPWLEWLAAEEIADDRRQAVLAHVSACSACRRELADWRALLAAAAEPDPALEAEMQGIDWDSLSARIAARGAAAGMAVLPIRRHLAALMPWAAAALIVAAGLIAFLRFPLRRAAPPASGADSAVIDHLQAGLARQEVIRYLQQSQLVFTDLLRECSGPQAAAYELRLYAQEAKDLLLKKRYFQQNLSSVEWLRVSPISAKIDWLSYEILQLEERQLCGQILRLQKVMEEEKLLLKIRLLEKDLSSQPIIEA